MLIWCIVLFALGVVAFLDSIFNYSQILPVVYSAILIFISMGLFMRVLLKRREGRLESYQEENDLLRERLDEIRFKNSESLNAEETQAKDSINVQG